MTTTLVEKSKELVSNEMPDSGSIPAVDHSCPKIRIDGCMVEIDGPPFNYYNEGEYTCIEVPANAVKDIKHSSRIIRFLAGAIVINVKNAVGISWIPSVNLDNVILKVRKPSAITLNLPDLLPRDLEGNVIEI